MDRVRLIWWHNSATITRLHIGVLHPGPWVQALVKTELFQFEYNIYTQELSEDDEIKMGNTIINTTIIC